MVKSLKVMRSFLVEDIIIPLLFNESPGRCLVGRVETGARKVISKSRLVQSRRLKVLDDWAFKEDVYDVL